LPPVYTNIPCYQPANVHKIRLSARRLKPDDSLLGK
jgi:hypothetical protein